MKASYHILWFLPIAVLSGCTLPKALSLAKDQSVVITPNPILVTGNKLDFLIKVNAPKGVMKKGTVYTINVFLHYADEELALESIKTWTQIPQTYEYKASKHYMIPYKDVYAGAMLEIEVVLEKLEKIKKGPRYSVAKVIN